MRPKLEYLETDADEQLVVGPIQGLAAIDRITALVVKARRVRAACHVFRLYWKRFAPTPERTVSKRLEVVGKDGTGIADLLAARRLGRLPRCCNVGCPRFWNAERLRTGV